MYHNRDPRLPPSEHFPGPVGYEKYHSSVYRDLGDLGRDAIFLRNVPAKEGWGVDSRFYLVGGVELEVVGPFPPAPPFQVEDLGDRAKEALFWCYVPENWKEDGTKIEEHRFYADKGGDFIRVEGPFRSIFSYDPEWVSGPIEDDSVPELSSSQRSEREQQNRADELELFHRIGSDATGLYDEPGWEVLEPAPATVGHGKLNRQEAAKLRALAAKEAASMLTRDEFERTYRANWFAARVGMPLNAVVVISWLLYGLDDNAGIRAAQRFRELFRSWLPDNTVAVFVDVLEVGPTMGLHSHFRCHVPERMKRAFVNWLPEAIRTAAEACGADPALAAQARLNLNDPAVKAMPDKEVGSRARKLAATPAEAFTATVRPEIAMKSHWREFRYTMKTLNRHVRSPRYAKGLGPTMAQALFIKPPGNARVPVGTDRVVISEAINTGQQKAWKAYDPRRWDGYEGDPFSCPLDNELPSAEELYSVAPLAEFQDMGAGTPIVVRRKR